MNGKLIAGRWVRWDTARARSAYQSSAWSRETLADKLKVVATPTPGRLLLVDGRQRIDGETLNLKAASLAHYLDRMPSGTVVSFMLPNWHEGAVIHLGATQASIVVG